MLRDLRLPLLAALAVAMIAFPVFASDQSQASLVDEVVDLVEGLVEDLIEALTGESDLEGTGASTPEDEFGGGIEPTG
ncbi:MAG: hypothetical protein AAGC60_23570 [Acidobacteriota bacterium]